MIWRATVATLALSAILTGYLAWLMFGEMKPTALGNVATLALIVTAAIAAALTWRLRDSVTA